MCSPLERRFTFSFSVQFTPYGVRFMLRLATTYTYIFTKRGTHILSVGHSVLAHIYIICIFGIIFFPRWSLLLCSGCMECATQTNKTNIQRERQRIQSPTTNAFGNIANKGDYLFFSFLQTLNYTLTCDSRTYTSFFLLALKCKNKMKKKRRNIFWCGVAMCSFE